MPRSIKWFIWLAFFYVAWCSFWNFKFMFWQTAHYTELLAKLPPSLRQVAEQADLNAALIRFTCYLLPFIVFAVLAGFFRRAWARWGLVIVLVVTETLWPLLYAGYTYFFQPEIYKIVMQGELQNWLRNGYRFDAAHWAHWFILTIMVVIVALLFSPNAKPWFRKST